MRVTFEFDEEKTRIVKLSCTACGGNVSVFDIDLMGQDLKLSTAKVTLWHFESHKENG